MKAAATGRESGGYESVKESKVGWISAVRPSRRPLRGLLRMTDFLNVIKGLPHPEERL